MTEYEEILNEIKEDGKIAEIYMKNPRQQQILICPSCAKTITPLAPYFIVRCKYCNKEFKSSPNPDIYSTYLKTIIKKLKNKNSLVLYLGMKWGEDILEEIAEDFKKLNKSAGLMVKIEGPFTDYKVDKNQCNQCGVCFSELRCLSCNEVFKNDSKCPSCGGMKVIKYYFNKVFHDKKKKKYLCPNCKSDDIKFTVFDGNLTKCPSCKTENITMGERKPYHILILRRYGGALLK